MEGSHVFAPAPALPDQRLFTGVARLAARHEGRFAPETVQRLLADSYALLATDAQVHTHLVVLAERLTAERLEALAKIQGAPGTEPATAVDPHAVQALTEVGADGSAASYPKPQGAPIAVVREIRDEIDAHITELLPQLGV
ncbi:three-helix bundle dimerization domain-containing protein [Streptomyces sp. NBC_00162]|uniref:three-helix bundle dimerization domain-containing protein n=1 Tax=Streptomyces sp. NBC_00162 TaxID=2903629 RepID=UPI00214B945C|nr:hypothetical protein [Streptomyces sp. NBC_00162]UUU38689.1 hypothetical protein JIW86_07600 [Streptomyces sp. NBC_00162]